MSGDKPLLNTKAIIGSIATKASIVELLPMALLEQTSRQLLNDRKLNTTSVSMIPVKADSVSEGVIKLAKTEHYDVVILGATVEGMLQQAIIGNISEAIATSVESTVILVRGAINN